MNKTRVSILIDKHTEILFNKGTPLFRDLLDRAEGEIKAGNTVYINTNQTLLGKLTTWFPNLVIIKR